MDGNIMNSQTKIQNEINLDKSERRQLMQIEAKIMNEWITCNPTHNTLHDLSLGKVHHFHPYKVFCDC